jgi:hypothetical protein
MPDISQAWVALLAALLGGSGLKIIEYLLNRSKTKDDTAAEFRTELRDEVKTLREQLIRAGAEVEKWRAQYYEVMDEFIKFKSMANFVNSLPPTAVLPVLPVINSLTPPE